MWPIFSILFLYLILWNIMKTCLFKKTGLFYFNVLGTFNWKFVLFNTEEFFLKYLFNHFLPSVFTVFPFWSSCWSSTRSPDPLILYLFVKFFFFLTYLLSCSFQLFYWNFCLLILFPKNPLFSENSFFKNILSRKQFLLLNVWEYYGFKKIFFPCPIGCFGVFLFLCF